MAVLIQSIVYRKNVTATFRSDNNVDHENAH